VWCYRPYYYDFRPAYSVVYVYGEPQTIYVEREAAPPTVVVQDAESQPAPTQVYLSEQEQLMDDILRGDAQKRQLAAQNIAKFKTIETAAVLIDVMINDMDPAVRQAAAKSLADIELPYGYEALVRAAQYELDENARTVAQTAADALKAKFGSELYLSPKMPPMNTGDPKLAKQLEDLRYGESDERKNAAGDLEKEKGTQATAALINALINDVDDKVRKEAAESLENINDRMALPFLKWSADNDPDDDVRDEAKDTVETLYNSIQ